MSDPATPHRPDRASLADALARLSDAALDRADANRDAPAIGRRDPALRPPLAIPQAGRPLDDVVSDLLDTLLPDGMRTDHPRFFAFIPSPASPLSWVGAFATSIHNLHAGAARQSEGASAIERSLIAWLCAEAGLPDTAGGLFVSGGSMANLAGLVAARDRTLAEGDRPAGVAYVTAQTHVSVAKALHVIGVRRENVRIVATDAALRMDAAALATTVAHDRARGLQPFAAIASAGATNTGAIDPLEAIADVCAEARLWMHVDGAYGASALLCPERRGLLAGIGRADSIAWDAHKWLFQTYGCGMLLVRERAALAESFRTGQDYLRDGAGESEPDFWDLGPELTRPARAVRLWTTLQAMGLAAVGEAIGRGFRLAEAAERALRATPGWEIVSPAQMAIVVFRYAPEGLASDAADQANLAAARRMTEDGYAVVGTTRIAGRAALRICAINPQTSDDDIAGTVARLDAFAREAAAR